MIVSAKLTVMTVFLLELLAAGYMFRKLGWRWPEVILALLTMAGSMPASLTKVLFNGFPAYSLFFSGWMLSLGMLADARRREKNGPVRTAIYLAIAFFFGLCGPRMFLFLYFPVFVVECCRMVRSGIEGGPLKVDTLVLNTGGGYS